MPSLPRNYQPIPYAGESRYVPSYGTLGELMGLRARSAAQGWQQLAGVFNQFVQQRQANEAAKLERADALAKQQAAEQLKRDEIAERRAEREAAQQLRKDAAERQSKIDARQKAEDVLPGVLSSAMADDLRPSGRVQVLDGVPVLMRTPAQQRQAALDAESKAERDRLRQDRENDNLRMQSQLDEQIRHNRATEAKMPRPLAREVIPGPDGPLLVNKETGQTERIIGPDGQAVKTAQSAQERMDSRKFSKAAPILRGIGELSERINTLQGVYAKAAGEAERQKAKINLNDDVAEYEALVSGFTPMIARSLGHTGVLTEQDVQSVKALFPRPGDSKSLRDRKINRMMAIIGELEGVEGVGGVAPAKPEKKNPFR